MQTMRLFAYQRPSRIAALLESLLQARGQWPRKARKVTDRSELPSALQKLVSKSQNTERVWNSWTDEDLRLVFHGYLPPALQRVAMQAQRCLQTWFAWTDGPRTWFRDRDGDSSGSACPG